jgi:multiple sugar transport system permease protein
MNRKISLMIYRWEIRLTHIILIFVCIIALLPIGATLLVSFKEKADILKNPPVLFPCDTAEKTFDLRACRWTWEGYQRVAIPEPAEESIFGFKITGNMFTRYIPNSILYAVSTGLLVVLLSSMAGFAFSRFKFKGDNALLIAIMAVTGVPYMVNVMGLYQLGITMRKTLPFYDDRLYLILVYLGFFVPMSVWIAKGFFDAIPRELEEAAIIDGMSRIGSLFRITIPLAMPGMMSIFLLTFVGVWNEFIVSYLLVSKNELKTVMFGLYDFLSGNVINYQVIAAACLVIALPTIILFVFTSKTFFKAMVEGAIKG